MLYIERWLCVRHVALRTRKYRWAGARVKERNLKGSHGLRSMSSSIGASSVFPMTMGPSLLGARLVVFYFYWVVFFLGLCFPAFDFWDWAQFSSIVNFMSILFQNAVTSHNLSLSMPLSAKTENHKSLQLAFETIRFWEKVDSKKRYIYIYIQDLFWTYQNLDLNLWRDQKF